MVFFILAIICIKFEFVYEIYAFIHIQMNSHRHKMDRPKGKWLDFKLWVLQVLASLTSIENVLHSELVDIKRIFF